MKKDFYARALLRDLWDPSTASLLLMGIDPSSTKGTALSCYSVLMPGRGSKPPAQYDEYQSLFQAIQSSIRAKKIPSTPGRVPGELPQVSPGALLAWAKKKGVDIPTPLQAIAQQSSDKKNTWPWGAYETELLKHLAAAAEHFWKDYQGDSGKAPKSDVVVRWLKDERGIPSRVAEIMAQILKADNVPAGPRSKRRSAI